MEQQPVRVPTTSKAAGLEYINIPVGIPGAAMPRWRGSGNRQAAGGRERRRSATATAVTASGDADSVLDAGSGFEQEDAVNTDALWDRERELMEWALEYVKEGAGTRTRE